MQVLSFKFLGVVLGFAIASLILLNAPPEGVPILAWKTLAVLIIMVSLWMTEAIHPSVTALLPMLLFPILNVSSLRDVASSYSNPIIYLFFGGFVLSLVITKWNLHQRIALFILNLLSGNAQKLMFGFMLTAALLSMWISNTATTIMLLPIGLAMITVIEKTVTNVSEQAMRNFKIALLLSIAYAATVGGVTTVIGTPPNAYMVGFLKETYNIEVSFFSWLLVGLPITLVLIPAIWGLLCKLVYPFNFSTSTETQNELSRLKQQLGSVKPEEKTVIAIFILAVVLWVTRPLLTKIALFKDVTDATIAIFIAVCIFIAPATKGKRLLEWSDTQHLPWGILVLFGGGLALASAMSSSGLAMQIGLLFSNLNVSLLLLIPIIIIAVILLTEVSGNISVVATFLPITAAVAVELNIVPIMIVVPVTLAASCAFMLPVATPPNAIVYSSGVFSIAQMSKAGLYLNLLSFIVISLVCTTIVPIILI